MTLDSSLVEQLEKLVSTPKTEQRTALRARLALACAQGLAVSEVARRHGVTRPIVRKWRDRVLQSGIAGLADAPRSGQPRKLSPETAKAIVCATQFETPPAGRTHWSCETMAGRFKTNRSAVNRIWRTYGLKPHLSETFKISTDPELVEKVHDVVGLYLNPPDRAGFVRR